jgi:hypothetical protein
MQVLNENCPEQIFPMGPHGLHLGFELIKLVSGLVLREEDSFEKSLIGQREYPIDEFGGMLNRFYKWFCRSYGDLHYGWHGAYLNYDNGRHCPWFPVTGTEIVSGDNHPFQDGTFVFRQGEFLVELGGNEYPISWCTNGVFISEYKLYGVNSKQNLSELRSQNYDLCMTYMHATLYALGLVT